MGRCRRRCTQCDAARARKRCVPSGTVGVCTRLTCSFAQQPAVCGAQVFFVVGRSNFIEDVQKLHVKGYDASGKDDAELEEEEDFSDDEKARQRRHSAAAANAGAELATDMCARRRLRRACNASKSAS